jgi:hypothetical protein
VLLEPSEQRATKASCSSSGAHSTAWFCSCPLRPQEGPPRRRQRADEADGAYGGGRLHETSQYRAAHRQPGTRIGSCLRIRDARCRAGLGMGHCAVCPCASLLVVALALAPRPEPGRCPELVEGPSASSGRTCTVAGSAGGPAQLVKQRLGSLIKERRLPLVADLHNRRVSEAGLPARLHCLHDCIKIRTTGYLLGDVFRSDELAGPLEPCRRRKVRIHGPSHR